MIASIIGGCLLGGLITLIVCLGIFDNGKKWYKNLLTVILTFVIFSGIFTMMFKFESDEWNNGVCADCNEEWIPYGKGRHGTTYYYCPNCHREIS